MTTVIGSTTGVRSSAKSETISVVLALGKTPAQIYASCPESREDAVKETEHRPLMMEQFPDWTDRVEYWDVDDLDCEIAKVALPYLEEKVRTLVARLRGAAETTPAKGSR
jgi:hypothetical protein